MKKNYIKFLFSIITLTVSIASFAQIPAPDYVAPDGSGTGGGDAPAPINSELIWLVIVGIFFAYFIFSTRNKKA